VIGERTAKVLGKAARQLSIGGRRRSRLRKRSLDV